ncbi:MAG: exodeoxyribonuclease VII large subunit, partial [Cellvibrionaceae bacterium]
MQTTPEKQVFTVSQLNRRAKQLLETHLPLIWVSGEISNLAKPASGHWYFSLKDNQAQVRCAMFRNANQRLRWQPESGNQVLIRARVSLYEGRGEYQLIAEHMEAAGDGLLQQQYEALKAKLHSEGLFDEERKQPLPTFPQHIAVITSPTGAAVHDILSVIKRRYPIAPVTILPVSVQGSAAAGEMCNALRKAQDYNGFDVIIIGRGGGSIEDLWAFNDETLARAIAHCSIPVVSAVGHEVDFTIADFVADQRAPTPSVSAEIITPDLSEWLQTLDYYQDRLQTICQDIIYRYQQRLLFLRKRLRHPNEKIRAQKSQLAYIQQSLVRSLQQQLSTKKDQLNHILPQPVSYTHL